MSPELILECTTLAGPTITVEIKTLKGVKFVKTYTPRGLGDFASCLCDLAPDSDECEKKLTACLGGGLDAETLCTCSCQSAESNQQDIDSCIKNCKTAKKIVSFCKKREVNLP
jgi:hypothetical protein